MRLSELLSSSSVPVHFVCEADVELNLDELGLKVMQGSLANLRTDGDLFEVVSSAMEFPAYFGRNWDALDECMRDMGWLPADGYLLVLYGSAKGWSQNSYALGRFVTSWLEAHECWAEEGRQFRLFFVM